MAIRQFYSSKAKPGWKLDKATGKYSSWGFDIRRASGRRIRESGFASQQHAADAAARIRLAEKNSKYELDDRRDYPTLAQLRQKRTAAVPDPAEKVRSERVLMVLEDCLVRQGIRDPRVSDLSPARFDLFAERRRADGVSDATINRELRTIRAAFNQVPLFWNELESWRPPRIRYLKVPRTRRERIVGSAEGRLILYHLLKPQDDDETAAVFLSRRRAGLLFLLSAITGARPGELVALGEADILHDIGSLRITGRKTRYATQKTVRYFPLLAIVKQILAEAVEISAGKFIFTQNGTLTGSYYDHIKTACKAAGVVYGRNVRGGFIPYDLRHTATTLLAQSGADIETISSITGQSQDSVWHYLHASKDSINRAAATLENFGQLLLSDGDLFSKKGAGLDKNQKPPP